MYDNVPHEEKKQYQKTPFGHLKIPVCRSEKPYVEAFPLKLSLCLKTPFRTTFEVYTIRLHL